MLITALVFAMAANAQPAPLSPPPTIAQVYVDCQMGVCLIGHAELEAITGSNAFMAAENARLRFELDEAKAKKKCATLEVVPPARGGKS